MPHSPELEQGVLGAAMSDAGSAEQVVAGLDDAAFYLPECRVAREAVAAVWESTGATPGPVLVYAELLRRGASRPDLATLTGWLVDAPMQSQVRGYVRQVRGLASARRYLAAGIELSDAARRGDTEACEAIVVACTAGQRADRPAGGLRPGAAFVLDDPADVCPVWGAGSDVLMAAGEPLLLVGPTGVGKSTLAQQLVAGRVGILDRVLGWPVQPDDRPVLYLALDRPGQIRRAMRRLFGPDHRAVLDDRLLVWEGPLPADLGKSPGTLAEIAARAGAGTVVIDSLKDAAVGLKEDEPGGNLNRAIQLVIADGREVIGLHHQRKAQGGQKPTRLEDVYGSVWITAGAGSVILLWGEPGAPVVELRHLKQPASEVGPLKIEHDHTTGRSTILHGLPDPLTALRSTPNGLTSIDLARLMFEVDKPTDSQRKRALRDLDRLVASGHAHKHEHRRTGDGGVQPARFHAIDHTHPEEP